MHPQQQRRVLGNGLGIVPQMRFIGRAHLAQDGATATHDIGDTELPADLDELPSRHNDLSSRRQGLQGQEDRRRIVIHHQRGLGPGEGF